MTNIIIICKSRQNKKTHLAMCHMVRCTSAILNTSTCWHTDEMLHQSHLVAHIRTHLMLLYSYSDMVRKVILDKTLISSQIASTQTQTKRTRIAHRPSCSRLLVQGTANSPPSTSDCIICQMSENIKYF